MQIVIDIREPLLYDNCKLVFPNVITESLSLGDILIKHNDQIIAIIERKSLSDLVSSIKDGRYEEQSHRLIHSSGIPRHNVIYIIEGMMSQIRDKQLVYSSITSLNYFKGFSVFRTASLSETAELIVAMTGKIERDLKKGKVAYTPDATSDAPKYCEVVKSVKKENVTPANMGEIVLCQVPGISSMTAIAIMKDYTSIYHLLDELKKAPDCLKDVSYLANGKSRKISKTCIENIKTYMLRLV